MEDEQPGISGEERPDLWRAPVEDRERDPQPQTAEADEVDAQLLLTASRRTIAALRRQAFELLRGGREGQHHEAPDREGQESERSAGDAAAVNVEDPRA